ncbi:MAG: sulfatase [Phycisphaerales bacterium]|nr:MAG: sulfatase [Phycisphaerales bacterium]
MRSGYRLHLAAIALLALIPSAGGCRKSDPSKPSQAGGQHPNVILISIDTLRADHLSTYGYFRKTSPILDRLAAQSIVFDQAFTPMSHTLPAHVSMVTGMHPATHNVLTNGWQYTGSFPTLAERLGQLGYARAGFVSGFPLNRDCGMARGFDVYEDTGRDEQGHIPKIPGDLATARAIEWLKRRPKSPIFLFLHYFDPHTPFFVPPNTQRPFSVDQPLREYMQALGVADVDINDIFVRGAVQLNYQAVPDLAAAINEYDNQVHHVDRLIGHTLTALGRLGYLRNAFLIVTSDHGEGLGQHHYYSHGLYLYEEQLRVPLIVRRFGGNWPAKRIPSTVSPLDLVPTVLELLGQPEDPQLHGRSLLPLITGTEQAPAGRWLLAQRRKFPGDKLQTWGRFASEMPLRAVRGDDNLKYFLEGDGTEQLYDLATDPLETENLAARRPGDCERLRALLEGLQTRYESAAIEAGEEMDEETMRALRSLGYVGP